MARITQIRWAKRTLCKIEAKLRKYCHKGGCEDFDECPLSCTTCRDKSFKLDLDTAIAWKAADIILNFMGNIEEFNDDLMVFYIHYNSFNKGQTHNGHRILMKEQINEMNFDLKLLVESLTSILSCQDIVSMHKLRYDKIWSPIRRTPEMFRTAVDWYKMRTGIKI